MRKSVGHDINHALGTNEPIYKRKPDTKTGGTRGHVTIELLEGDEVVREIQTENIQKDYLDALGAQITRHVGMFQTNRIEHQQGNETKIKELHLLYDPNNLEEAAFNAREGELVGYASTHGDYSGNDPMRGARDAALSSYNYDPATNEMVYKYGFIFSDTKAVGKINKIGLSMIDENTFTATTTERPWLMGRLGSCYTQNKSYGFENYVENSEDSYDFNFDASQILEPLKAKNGSGLANKLFITGNLLFSPEPTDSTNFHLNVTDLSITDPTGLVNNKTKLDLGVSTGEFKNTNYQTCPAYDLRDKTLWVIGREYKNAESDFILRKYDLNTVDTAEKTPTQTYTLTGLPLAAIHYHNDYPYVQLLVDQTTTDRLELFYRNFEGKMTKVVINAADGTIVGTPTTHDICRTITAAIKISDDEYIMRDQLTTNKSVMPNSDAVATAEQFKVDPTRASGQIPNKCGHHYSIVKLSEAKMITAAAFSIDYNGSHTSTAGLATLLDTWTGSILAVRGRMDQPMNSSAFQWFTISEYRPPQKYLYVMKYPEIDKLGTQSLRVTYELRVKLKPVTELAGTIGTKVKGLNPGEYMHQVIRVNDKIPGGEFYKLYPRKANLHEWPVPLSEVSERTTIIELTPDVDGNCYFHLWADEYSFYNTNIAKYEYGIKIIKEEGGNPVVHDLPKTFNETNTVSNYWYQFITDIPQGDFIQYHSRMNNGTTYESYSTSNFWRDNDNASYRSFELKWDGLTDKSITLMCRRSTNDPELVAQRYTFRRAAV